MKMQTNSPSSRSPKFPFLRACPDGALIMLRVQPGAPKNEAQGVRNNRLKVRLTSPPVEGRANDCLIGFLSKILGVKKSALALIAGHKSRDKTVKISGASLVELEKAIATVLE